MQQYFFAALHGMSRAGGSIMIKQQLMMPSNVRSSQAASDDLVRFEIHAWHNAVAVGQQADCGGPLTVPAIWHMSAHETGTGTTLSTTSFAVCEYRTATKY